MLVFSIFSFQLISAQYISGDIYLNDKGEASFYLDSDKSLDIEGLSLNNNRISGKTELLSNKIDGIWYFTIKSGNYKTILLDIHLPKNVKSINSIQGNSYLLDIDNKVISFIDNDNKLDFEVSYKLNKTSYLGYFYLFIIVIFIICILLFIVKRYIKKSEKNKRLKYIMPLVGDNEEKIISLLMKGQMRQKEIRKKLGIPKASFSRYLINLERKKLIIREGEGKNKIVRLK